MTYTKITSNFAFVLCLFAVLPVSATTTVVLQPGPNSSKDIWTTSVYSYAPGGGGPGGGLDNDDLRVGGWGDQYYTLIEFDLSAMPSTAVSATLSLYAEEIDGATPMYLDRITEHWDWRTQGNGADFDRLWWVDRPAATQIDYLSALPSTGAWYDIDLTSLYNDWQSGTVENYGIQLRPQTYFPKRFMFFASSAYADSDLRPKLVVETNEVVIPEPSSLLLVVLSIFSTCPFSFNR